MSAASTEEEWEAELAAAAAAMADLRTGKAGFSWVAPSGDSDVHQPVENVETLAQVNFGSSEILKSVR